MSSTCVYLINKGRKGERICDKKATKDEYCTAHYKIMEKRNKKSNASPVELFGKEDIYMKVSSNRIVANLEYFNSNDPIIWENLYQAIQCPKYKKNTRNFNKTVTGKPEDEKLIYMIPRVRGGASFKERKLLGIEDNNNVQYCPISKGYGMQNVSSFTLGPVIGEGLCLVNAAFSKSVCIMHIEGGGVVDYKRKNFWKSSRKPERQISIIDDEHICVDGNIVETFVWLKDNEDLWLKEWMKWRNSIALCSLGDFHWTRLRAKEYSPTIAYYNKGKYLNFVEWKIECYVKPSYKLLPGTDVIIYLKELYEKNIPLGLVHPKSVKGEAEIPVTKEFLINLFNDSNIMCCQPYVVAAFIINIKL